MKKIQRRHIKEEKRIVRLLYRKGLIDNHDPNNLYWTDYNYLFNRREYKNRVPVMEVHFCSVDYWGEVDEHSLVSEHLELLWWDGAYDFCDETGYPDKSTFNIRDRRGFIKYLEALPTTRCDSKINVALKVRNY